MSKQKYQVTSEEKQPPPPQQHQTHSSQKKTQSALKPLPEDKIGDFKDLCDLEDEEESIYEVPLPPDGGWGWVIMIASFFTNMIVDGVCYTFGIVFMGLMETFEAGETITALVGSLVPGVYLIVGPIVSVLMTKFGCRLVAIVGSFIASIFFFVSAFSTSIYMMLVCYGIMGGVGFGLMYLPSIVMVGYYFDKKRALATGIAVCGSGIGTFLFAPIGSFLVETYGWRGCNIIMSAVILNGVAFGACYRPLVGEKRKKERVRSGSATPSGVKYETGDVSNRLQIYKGKRDRTISERSTSDGAVITVENEVLNEAGDNVTAVNLTSTTPTAKTYTGSTNKITSSRMSLHHSRVSLKSHQERQADVENPMLRKDALLIGSHRNLDEYKNVDGDVEDFTKEMVMKDAIPLTKGQQIKKFLLTMFDFSLLKCVTFMLLAFSGVFVFTGLYTPFVFVAQKAINELGVTESKANLILSVLGVSRIVTGFVSDLKSVDVIVVQNVAAILAGISTCLLCVLNSYWLLCIYAAFFGITIAAYIALRSIVMVEMLGLSKLNNAFGLTALFQGVAVLIGSPMSGALYNSTGSYTASFVVCGILISLGGVICIPVRRIAKWENPKNEPKLERSIGGNTPAGNTPTSENNQLIKDKRDDSGVV
ncbi:hypothetical protein HELRODRAFT_194347 [Helobdella robusta]|uniref:Major facilitator superfamily (MFS) profile domain-containing protein n=1 Tax=Helobdella robusta TaxID=6412 RepID=T1FVY7_HELRO|nr:hypothetical protein HELRODRAFT_194347 [Helobdella robusta]ESN92202.1 hypothetical protein HELRODRAFT_194347 [Helobdella robusta]